MGVCIGVNSSQVGQLVVKKVGDGGVGARESVQLCKPGGDVPCDLVYASAEPPSWQNFAGGLNGRQEGKSKFSKPTKRR